MRSYLSSLLAAAAAQSIVKEPRVPTIKQFLLDKYFLGRDIMQNLDVTDAFSGLANHAGFEECANDNPMEWFGEVTHLPPADIDYIISLVPGNISWWIEFGSFHGGSAIRTAEALRRSGQTDATLSCVDTFLGDTFMYWDFMPCSKKVVMGEDGTQKILKQFVSKVRDAGYDNEILAFPATSIVAMRAFQQSLFKWPELGRPEVIYLDSAHLQGEVLIEMEMAWKLLPKGGILMGDDWYFIEVRQDVLQFATMYERQFDHRVLVNHPPGFRVDQVRNGAFVSHAGEQWFFVKDVEPGDDGLTHEEYAMRSQRGAWGFAYCFKDSMHVPYHGPSYEQCCDPEFGPHGNPLCWDEVFVDDICCPYWPSPGDTKTMEIVRQLMDK